MHSVRVNLPLSGRGPSFGYAFAKRAFDIAAAGSCLLVTSPICLVVTIAILCDDGGPVLHKGWRVGRHGRHFRILKFRTMVVAADRNGPPITVADDPRVTRVGRFLRRNKLDELPQLLNVLLGDMSFVGPRPEDPMYVRQYSDEQRRVLAARPGITSVASLRYRNEEQLLKGPSVESQYRAILADKLRLDLEYFDHCSFWSDLRLILATLTRLSSMQQ